jgi:hypothetical protein
MTVKFKNTNQELSLCDCLEKIILNEPKEEVENIIATIYHIWKARNDLVFRNKEIPVMVVNQQASAAAREYRLQSKPQNKPHQTTDTQARSHNKIWSPPARDTLKLNVDAHPRDDGRWGLGIVLCAEDGGCFGAATKEGRGSDCVLEGEALGLNAALDLVEEQGLHRITFEMDALTTVLAVQQQRYPRTYWGKVARRCGTFINRNPLSNITWVCISGNKAAHQLANWASLEPNMTWINETPPCIMEYIQKDISFL